MGSTKKSHKKAGQASRFYQHKLGVFMAISLLGTAIAGGMYFALQHINPQHIDAYTIQGFDVSRHQGDIDWNKIDAQRYQFVFIKATEGGDYQDPKFAQNWLAAHEKGFNVGAYHFYRNCKTGLEQAQNYIQTVPIKQHSLPPVMDLEFQWACPEVTAEQLQQQIAIMSKTLEQHYGKKPILYTTPNYYRHYIKGHFDDHILWLQNIGTMPPRIDQRPWLFWQYSQTGKITGITTLVDLNFFRGSAQDFNRLIHPDKTTAATDHDQKHP